MKILWVLDEETSALSISARSKNINHSQFVYSVDYPSVSGLVKRIVSSGADIVVFSWRQALRDILKSRRGSEMLATFPMDNKIAVLIPDYLDSSPESVISDSSMFLAVDGVLTTNQELQNLYSELLEGRLLVQKLFDTVSSSLSLAVEADYLKVRGQVVWVGNSKWGHRLGIHDHKGFHHIVKPLASMCEVFGCGHNYIFIDSSKERLPHEKVLDTISKSEYLIQASISEGTGMPVLESLLYKTVPITTNVGVAPEVLKGELSFLIAEGSARDFFEILHDPRTRDLVNSPNLSFAYMAHSRFDPLVPLSLIYHAQSSRMINHNREWDFSVALKYIFRFIRHFLRVKFSN
jgi:glycosyltransferase involved in cell wall biosynthesis